MYNLRIALTLLFKHPISKKFLNELRHPLLFVCLFSSIINFLALTVPIYMLQMYDRILPSHSVDSLIFITLISILSILVLSTLDFCRLKILYYLSVVFENAVNKNVLIKLPDLNLLGKTTGSQILKDISFIRQFISSPIFLILFDIPWSPLFLVVIFFLNIWLGLLATIGVFILLLIAYWNEIKTHQSVAKSNSQGIEIQHQIDLNIRNAEAIQAMGMINALKTRWDVKHQNIQLLQEEIHNNTSFALSIAKFIRLFLQIAILGLGTGLVLANKITAGMMIAGSIILAKVLAPIEQAISSWKQFIGVLQSYERLLQILELQLPREAGIQLPSPKGKVTFEKVSYRHGINSDLLIQNIHAEIEPGENIAIVGGSGAGKSTLARLIVGAIPPTNGCVRLDGANVYSWDREDFGQYVGYLPQDIELFPGTIKENITRFKEPNDDLVIQAAIATHLHELILKTPLGYQTVIGTGYFELSAGIKQRLALTRAIYGTPKLIVLDEPDSNLDTEGEEALLTVLKQLKNQSITTIIVSHRLPLLQLSDRFMILQGGKLIYFGPRDKLNHKFPSVANSKPKTNQSPITTPP